MSKINFKTKTLVEIKINFLMINDKMFLSYDNHDNHKMVMIKYFTSQRKNNNFKFICIYRQLLKIYIKDNLTIFKEKYIN